MYVTPETSICLSLTLICDRRDQWVDAVLSMKNPPQTISTSYADHEQTGTWLISFHTHLFCSRFHNLSSPNFICETGLQQLRTTWWVEKFLFYLPRFARVAGRGQDFLFSLECLIWSPADRRSWCLSSLRGRQRWCRRLGPGKSDRKPLLQ